MTQTVDSLLTEYSMNSTLMAAWREAEAACAPYGLAYNWLADEDEDAPEPITIGRWRIYPSYFLPQLEVLIKHGKKYAVPLAAKQVTEVLDNGAERVLTERDIRSLPPAEAKQLLALSRTFGDVKGDRPPSLADGDGDGITGPLTLNLSRPVGGYDDVTFECETLEDLEYAGLVGNTTGQLLGLLHVSDLDSLDKLAPADGWYILKNVLPKVQKAARKALTGVRSYEFALKFQFDPATPISILASRQAEYAKLFKRKAEAEKAATSRAKQRRKR